MFGSKYDTPFWKEAKKISFKDSLFDKNLLNAKQHSFEELLHRSKEEGYWYGQWSAWNFKYWYEGMTNGKD